MINGKKILLILPYFGTLPPNWHGFVNSCKDNSDIDFLFISDCDIEKDIAPNIKVIRQTWADFTSKVISDFRSLGYKRVCLSHPYKLCDMKPAYGFLFKEYIGAYDYWGYMDCDLVWGNMKKFLTEVEFDNYDRVFKYGHLSLYRNTDRMNLLFTKEIRGITTFRYAISTSLSQNFDEIAENQITIHEGIPFYNHSHDASFINTDYEYRWRNLYRPDLGEVFVRDASGATYSYAMNEDGSIDETEVMYIHFLTKKNIVIPDEVQPPYVITRKGVFHFDKTLLLQMIESTVCTNEEQATFHKEYRDIIRRRWKKSILMEIKYNKWRSPYYFARRMGGYLEYIKYLLKRI